MLRNTSRRELAGLCRGTAIQVATLLVALGCAVGLPACAAGAEINTATTPIQVRPGVPEDAAAAQSVRAFLHTLKVNEKELTEGFTIPFAVTQCGELAKATGKTGPNGHQVYQIISVYNCTASSRYFLEIAPE